MTAVAEVGPHAAERRWPALIERAALVARPAPATRIGWRGAAVGACGAVVAGLACLERIAGPGATNTVYAEDGSIFLSQATTRSFLHALTTPYAGYFHAVPRLLTEIAAAVPLADAASALAIAAASVTALLALVVYRAAGSHVRTRAGRLVIAAAVVAIPVGQAEVPDAVANLHWILLGALAWMLLWDQRDRWEIVVGSAVVVLTALSDPFALALVPLALVRIVGGPRRARVVPLALCAAVAAHWAAIAVAQPERNNLAPTANVLRVSAWYVTDVAGHGVVGGRGVGGGASAAVFLAGCAVLAGLGALAYAVRARLDGGDQAALVALVGSSAALFVVPVVLSGTHPLRYAVPPAVLLVSAGVLVVERALDGVGRRQVLGIVGVSLLAVLWLANLRVPTPRSVGPSWSASVRGAQAACAGAAPDAHVSIPIAPVGWTVDLPCSAVPRAERSG